MQLQAALALEQGAMVWQRGGGILERSQQPGI
jgi:hypothetical protein